MNFLGRLPDAIFLLDSLNLWRIRMAQLKSELDLFGLSRVYCTLIDIDIFTNHKVDFMTVRS